MRKLKDTNQEAVGSISKRNLMEKLYNFRCYHLDSQFILHKVIGTNLSKMRKDYLITCNINPLAQLFVYNKSKHHSRVA